MRGNNKSRREEQSLYRKVMDKRTIPYMRGLCEAVERTLKRHGIANPVRPYKTLLVHPKNKRSGQESRGVI